MIFERFHPRDIAEVHAARTSGQHLRAGFAAAAHVQLSGLPAVQPGLRPQHAGAAGDQVPHQHQQVGGQGGGRRLKLVVGSPWEAATS